MVDLEAVRSRLSAKFGRVEILPPPDVSDTETALFVIHDLPTGEIDGGPVACSLALLTAPLKAERDALRIAIRQTWDWPDASNVAEAAQSSTTVATLASWTWLDRKTLLEVLQSGVEAVERCPGAIALHWPQCERLVSPASYRAARAESDDPLYPAVNVRMFRLTDARPEDEELLMDTLGLAPFGLPDLQVRYVDLEPNQVAGKLSDLALYLFENGDVIHDAHTVDGVPGNTVWVCERKNAAIEPEREVIDLTPAN
jgi:hypothetical protein